MSSLSPFDKPLTCGPPIVEEEKAALGHLALRYLDGQITRAEFRDIAEMLGLIPSAVDDRPKRGHMRGLRAVPADYRAKGAEAS